MKMTRAEALNQVGIPSDGFVIDVGGGHRPFPRANLVIEKYPFNHGAHRTEPMKFPPVAVIKADACNLPVPDASCNLIVASHLIEHLADPQSFVSELKRCAQRVYLEFPSRHRELMLAWSFHEWLVEPDGPVLKFYRNDLPQLFGSFFHEEHDAALGAWSDQRHELLNTSFYHRSDEIECEFPMETATEMLLRESPRGERKVNYAPTIHRARYSSRELFAFAAQSLLSGKAYAALSRKHERALRPAPLPDSIVARLMCLHCRKTNLRRTGDMLVCVCGAEYRSDRGVFDFDVTSKVLKTAV
jgi:SAM-dependent methyltransferase